LKKVLQEGKIYVISRFEVSKNKEKYDVVENNPSMLSFYGGAVVTEDNSDDNTIPRYIFEFVNFNDMPKRCGKEVLAGWFIKILNYMSYTSIILCKECNTFVSRQM
jgi:hypothetical protein